MISLSSFDGRPLFLIPGLLLLQACGGSNSSGPPQPVMASFDITVANLTNAQPLSPVAVIAHQDGYRLFSVGSAASLGLEELAEGGDNTALLAEAGAEPLVVATATGAAPIGPAGSEAVSLEVPETELPGLRMSVGSMLVNTNDGFSAVNAAEVGDLAVGEVISIYAIAYDAGTEADTELAAEIPGPAGGGEGFNPARDDLADRVAMHAGVVSQDDGFATSDLTGQTRFDNPVVRVLIERVN